MTQNQLAELIYKHYGTVKRARSCFLYTKKGVRLTDLFQQNGRAILGWDAGNAFTFFKNTLNRGTTGFFRCEEKSQVEKSVETLLNSKRKIFYFNSKQEALKAGLNLSPESTSIWTPWNQSGIDFTTITSIIFTPPLPWTDSFYILALKKEIFEASSGANENTGLIKGDVKLPYPLETAIARANYNLAAVLNERQEKDWFIYDTVLTKYFERKGPYLYSKVPESKYDEFIEHCLDCGIVINPNFNAPSIVPFGADKGVFNKLKNSDFKY